MGTFGLNVIASDKDFYHGRGTSLSLIHIYLWQWQKKSLPKFWKMQKQMQDR